MLHLAVPSLSAELQPSSAQLLWIIDIYGFLVAGCAHHDGHARRPDRPPPAAADRRRRVRPRLVLAAFSTSAEMLIASRALLGIAGATMAPSTLSLIRNMFHDPRSARSRSASGSPLLARRRDRAARRRACCSSTSGGARSSCSAVPVMALLLVLGPIAAARVPRPRRRAARPRQRCAFARRGARGRSTASRDRPGRLRRRAGRWRSLVGLAVGAAVRSPPDDAWPIR